MKKSVTFKTPVRQPTAADMWVADRKSEMEQAPVPVAEPTAPPEVMKRFTIDVPERLHTRIKVTCAQRGLKMADVLRDLLEREFPAEKRESGKPESLQT